MDFTTSTYKRLLAALQTAGYSFQTVVNFIQSPLSKTVILRHDVDLLPGNALRMARLEHESGVVASYYFRAVPESWDEGIIREIAPLDHEIGYHYENLTTASKKVRKLEGEGVRGSEGKKVSGLEREKVSGKQTERLYEIAYEDFCRNLERLRAIVPVSTVCMHGSPLSGIDNLDLLKKCDYKSLGLVAEPYLDIDFDQVFYLTDTGRRWDGWKVSVRDKMPQQKEWVMRGLVFHTTWDIIRMADSGKLPDKIMMTVHPQRWNDRSLPWLRELVFQSVKNLGKRLLIAVRAGR